MGHWTAGQPSGNSWEKAPGDPVSEADLACDALLRERLSALLPQAAWLSEESAETPGRSDARFAWLIDPIDGTRDFVRGRPGWAVSVALAEQGVVQMGVLIAPARGERWWAARGGGAFRNGERLRVGAHATLAGARVPLDNLRGIDAPYTVVAKPNGIALRMSGTLLPPASSRRKRAPASPMRSASRSSTTSPMRASPACSAACPPCTRRRCHACANAR